VWWAGSTALDVYLGTRTALVCRQDQRVLGSSVAGVDAALDAIGAALSTLEQRQRLRVWLSGGLCRPFVLPNVAGLRNGQEIERMATALAADATGLQGPLNVWMEPGSASRAQVAVAMPANVRQRIEELAASRRSRVVALRPWWAEVQRAALAQQKDLAALSVQDCDSVTLLLGNGDDLELVSTVTPVVSAESARTAFARALLSSSVDATAALSIALVPDQADGSGTNARMALGSLSRVVDR
jgi:hypothetical protein